MAELLIQVGEGKFGDGGIIVVRRDYDALRVHAEMIARRRNDLLLPPKEQRRLLNRWQEITRGNRRVPSESDLAAWWTLAEGRPGLRRSDFLEFPFGLLEQRVHLVVPLDADVDEPTAREWERPLDESDEDNQTRRYRVAWRTQLVRPTVREADVLDRLKLVAISPQRAAIVTRRMEVA